MSVYVAKMTTKYPDFHGEGYYNFVMSTDEGELADKIERQEHDFRLVKMVELEDFDDIDEVIEMYPSKQALNEAEF